jgi:hypothetical protein
MTTITPYTHQELEKGILHREQAKVSHTAAYHYTAVLLHQDLLLARVGQVLASADEVERQYVAAAIRGAEIRR